MKCVACGFDILFENAKFCPKCGAKTGDSTEHTVREEVCPDISTVWPEWRLESLLGKGSYGSVYKAVRNDSGIETQAAVKIISVPSDKAEIDSVRADGIDENSAREYFRNMVKDVVQEIKLMISFKGIQNIVSVEDYKVVEKTGEIGWDIYIRMELLKPFNTYISDKRLTEADVIRLGIDIATALEICSKKGVIHRDIKPENIFINDFGYFKLGDFGVARTLENKTSGMSQKGTYNYMAPEVVFFKDYDERVDICSLGLVLYKLLNDNRLPFLNSDKQIYTYQDRKDALDKRMSGVPLPPPCSASDAMTHIILKACAYKAEDRFMNATQLKEALTAVVQGKYTDYMNPGNEDSDRTVWVKHSGGAVNDHGGYGINNGVPAEGNGGFVQAKAQDKQPESGNKSYVSIIVIAVALGLLTGVLIGGIILLTKFSSGQISLCIGIPGHICEAVKNILFLRL